MQQQTDRRYQSFFIAAISLAVLGGIPALTTAQEDSSDRQATTLDTITVTANKQEENVQEVPQSITVIDEEILEEKGIKSVVDVIEQVPNLSLGSWGDFVNFRGLNASFFTSKNPVVIYIDGVPITDAYFYEAALSNAQRVEVLRGPQGSLYGKDAIGAVINIVTKKPNNTLGGNVGLEYGTDNTIDGKFNVSAPLIDEKLYFGLTARGYYTDGFITNHYNDDKKAGKKDKLELGAYLLARPIDRLSLRLNLSHEPRHTHISPVHVLQGSHDIKDFKRDGAKDKNHNKNLEYSDDNKDTQSLNVTYDFDTVRFESITTHLNIDNYGSQAQDYGAKPNNKLYSTLDKEVDEYTQELRLSNKDDKVRWLVGLYADMDTMTMDMDVQFPPSSHMDNYVKQKNKSMAAFGQVKFPVVENLNLTLGGRLQKIKKDTHNLSTMHTIENPNAKIPLGDYKTEKTWNAFLPKIALDYKLNSHLMPYVSFSQGYMPGGFTYFPMTKETASFEPQHSNNYELGIKGMYSRFNFNLNVFRLDIKDIHIMKEKYISDNIVYIAGNAKKAHSQGMECDFNYWPTNEIEISGALGVIDAKYDDYGNGTIKRDGKRIEKTPKYTGNIGIAYYHGSGIYGRIDGNIRGKSTFYKQDNTPMDADGAITGDIKLGYRVGDFDIYGFVNNITDEEYINNHYDRGDISLAGFNDPRTFGIGINYKF